MSAIEESGGWAAIAFTHAARGWEVGGTRRAPQVGSRGAIQEASSWDCSGSAPFSHRRGCDTYKASCSSPEGPGPSSRAPGPGRQGVGEASGAQGEEGTG